MRGALWCGTIETKRYCGGWMPPKIRKLKSDLQKAGFVVRPAKGSHTVWYYPLDPSIEVTLAGNDGNDRIFHYPSEGNPAAQCRP